MVYSSAPARVHLLDISLLSSLIGHTAPFMITFLPSADLPQSLDCSTTSGLVASALRHGPSSSGCVILTATLSS